MRSVIIDDEKLSIDLLCYFLNKYKVDITATYTNAVMALNNAETDRPDVLFVDIEMPEINGIMLARSLKSLFPDIIIIFITAYSQYAVESFEVQPLDYLLKPVTEGRIVKMLENIKKQYELLSLKNNKSGEDQRVQIKCFGKFEVLKNGKEAMKFPTTKCRELLSYLICKANKPVYKDELMTALFTGRENMDRNNYYVTVSRLKSALIGYGADETAVKLNKNLELYIEKGICDLYDFFHFIRYNDRIGENNILEAERLTKDYYGELFSNLDTEWTNESKEWLEIQMEELMLSMAEFYEESSPEKQESILKKLLLVNPMSTRGYEELLAFYMEMDEKEKYKQLFKKYANIMKMDLQLDVDKRFLDYMISQVRGIERI